MMKKFKILSRRNTVILFSLAAIILAMITVGLTANHAYASVAGSDVSGSAGSGAYNDAYLFRGDISSPDVGSMSKFLESNGFTGTGSQGQDFTNELKAQLDNAINKCEALESNCLSDSPRVVALLVNTAHGDKYLASKGIGNFDASKVPTPIDINIQGSAVSTTQKMKGGSIDSYVLNWNSSTLIGVVVMTKSQYKSTGWKQSWETIPYSDVKSVGANDAANLTACPVYYYVSAQGTDGYTKGLSSSTKKVLTPYGELWNVIDSGGGSWTDKAGGTHTWMQADKQPQGDYGSDPVAATARAVADIKNAKDIACAETYKMKISYDINTEGGTAGKELNEAFAKGGQYKIVKSARNATLTVHQLNLKYYWRTSDYHRFDGWVTCDDGDAGCGYIGKSKPTNNPSNYYVTGPWQIVADEDVAMIKNVVNKGGSIYDRQLASVKDAADATIGWNTSNKGVRWYAPSDKNKNKWIFGSTTGYIDGSNYYAVSNELQSILPVSMQDFLNMNCNQTDFKKIVDWTSRHGILDESSVKSTKYNGSFSTVVMTTQKMWRAMEILTNTEGLNPSAYTAGSYPGLDALSSKWSSTGTESGDADPIYTKECPLDCTADVNANRHAEGTVEGMNGNFEYPSTIPSSEYGPGYVNKQLIHIYPESSVYNGRSGKKAIPGFEFSSFKWRSTQKWGVNSVIEMHRDVANNNHFVEIVAEQKNTSIYQDIPTIPGATYTWSIDHASLNNGFLDKMSVLVGAPRSSGVAQQATRTTTNGHGDAKGAVGTVIATKVSNSSAETHQGQWETYTGTYTVPAGQTITRFWFKDIDSYSATDGNLIDNVSFKYAYDSTGSNLNNVRANAGYGAPGASASDKAKNSYGIIVSVPDLSGSFNTKKDNPVNTADAILFRNNEWNYLTLDHWSPLSGGGIIYDNSAATTTTIVRNNGTPWMINGKQATQFEGSTDGSTWKTVFGSGNGSPASQWGSASEAAHKVTYQTGDSAQLLGDINQIRIKSPWASDQGKDLRFNIKWEYVMTNSVTVPRSFEINGQGTPDDNVIIPSPDTETTKVDGKCEAQYHNAGQSYVDHTTSAYDNSGQGVKDTIDADYRGSTNQIGWFGVSFVRASGE